MRFNRTVFLTILVLLSWIFFIGCGSGNGSYLSPMGVMPYSSGSTGTLTGTVKGQIYKDKYFDYAGDIDTTEEDNGDEDEDEGEDEDEDEESTDAYDDVDFLTEMIRAKIRVAGRTYDYNPAVEKEFYIADIPVGFHTITLEVPGMKPLIQTVSVDAGVQEMDFVLSHPEELRPNYYKEIVNVSVDLKQIDEDDTSDTAEVYFDLINVNTARFVDKEILVYLEDEDLLENDVMFYKDEFIEMLGIWESTDIGISFEFTNDRSEADITAIWVDNSDDVISAYTMTDPESVLRNFKPVIYFSVFIPGTDNNIPNTSYRKTIMLREIGRALGLNGSSQSNNDIMYYGQDLLIEGDVSLSTADINTLKMLYQTTPAKNENTYEGF